MPDDTTDRCPKCGSTNVWVGAFPLDCEDCGWHYLNENPCGVCGEPSVSGFGVNGATAYRCSEHPLSLEDMAKAARPWVEAIVNGGR